MSFGKLSFLRKSGNGGQTLLLFALFMIVLICFVGLGIDLGFAYITKANLSKAVDSACLTAVRNLSLGDPQATALAKAAFAANYGKPGRDVGTVDPTVDITTNPINKNRIVTVTANTTINTFFIRVLGAFPGMPAGLWQTMNVGAIGAATRAKLIMSLVLDRSGSMGGNGGMTALKQDIPIFIDLFDDTLDRVSMSSFAYHSRVDFPMGQPFKTPIKTAVAAFVANGYTAAEPSVLMGYQQNQSVAIAPGEDVVKVIVFFTDGIANTWQTNFVCSGITNKVNIAENRSTYNITNGLPVAGCVIPPTMTSIDGTTTFSTSSQAQMDREAEKRAEQVALEARVAGNIIYSIGLGNQINQSFLKTMANDGGIVSTNQTKGLAVFAPTAADLKSVFQTIAADILLRITQ